MYRGGYIQNYIDTDMAICIHNRFYNQNKYKYSMYYATSLDPKLKHMLLVASNSFYGLLSMDMNEQLNKSRFMHLKLLIKYRLKHYYNKEVSGCTL